MTKRKKIDIPIEDDDRQEGEVPETELPPGDEITVDMELKKTLDHLKRLQAEFDNYRKRTDRERHQTVSWAQSMLATELLPVLDDMERALSHMGEDGADVAEGFTMVTEKFQKVLVQAGLERISAAGEEFDPNLHEALLTEPVESARVGTVLEELVPGYRFKDRVIRPARVKVGMERSE